MKEVTIISGKGGTGKTSVMASFATLSEGRFVLADCDVDAADLHLLLQPDFKKRLPFIAGISAAIDPERCTQCGLCEEVCRFDAIRRGPDGVRIIDPLVCEGCGVCAWFCPPRAIDCEDALCGESFVSDTRLGPMVHARLGVGGENSGKLVSRVRDTARSLAVSKELEGVLVDGPPGIGCSVIASVTGVQHVLVVVEPSLSGLHDLERVASLTKHFDIPAMVCVNRWDVNPEQTQVIEQWAVENGLKSVGRIRSDRAVVEAQLVGKTLPEYTEKGAGEDVRRVWDEVAGLAGLRKEKEERV